MGGKKGQGIRHQGFDEIAKAVLVGKQLMNKVTLDLKGAYRVSTPEER